MGGIIMQFYLLFFFTVHLLICTFTVAMVCPDDPEIVLRLIIQDKQNQRLIQRVQQKQPTVKLVKPAEVSDEECTVCLESFGKERKCVVLFCDPKVPHVFCNTCLDDWKQRSNTCPTCRTPLPSEHRIVKREQHSVGSIFLPLFKHFGCLASVPEEPE